MDLPLDTLAAGARHAVSETGRHGVANLFSPGSPLSLTSLTAVLFAAGAIVLWKARGRRRPVSLRLMARCLLPRRMRGRSMRVDLGLLVFNTTVYGVMFGWALVTQDWVSDRLLALAGARGAGLWANAPAALIVGTVALFLAAELGSYITHWLSHRIPALWELHKVHHSAEALTPATVFRVHPLEGVLFANVLALTMGVTDAALTAAFGPAPHDLIVFDRNVLALGGLYLVQHLQHTEFWIMAPGPLRNLIHSPAHHQIHHSENPAHYGKNLGALLTLWDWVFGTLYTPDARRPALTFGLGAAEANHGSFGDAVARPLAAITAGARPAMRRRGAAQTAP